MFENVARIREGRCGILACSSADWHHGPCLLFEDRGFVFRAQCILLSFNGLTNPVTVFVLSVALVAELLTSWMRWRFDRFRSHDCYCKIMSCSYKKHALLDAVGHCGSSQYARSPVDASDWSRSTTAFRSNTALFYCRDQMKVPWCKSSLRVVYSWRIARAHFIADETNVLVAVSDSADSLSVDLVKRAAKCPVSRSK